MTSTVYAFIGGAVGCGGAVGPDLISPRGFTQPLQPGPFQSYYHVSQDHPVWFGTWWFSFFWGLWVQLHHCPTVLEPHLVYPHPK